MRQTSKNVSPMSNEGRNLYVITHITESLLELLKDKPLNDISISELCSHAQVGRATFYRNFEVKEDVLNVYIHKLFSEWIDTYESNPPKTISQMVRELFLHLEKYRDFYGLLSERGLIYLLKNVLLEIYAPKPEQPAQAAYASSHHQNIRFEHVFQRHHDLSVVSKRNERNPGRNGCYVSKLKMK